MTHYTGTVEGIRTTNSIAVQSTVQKDKYDYPSRCAGKGKNLMLNKLRSLSPEVKRCGARGHGYVMSATLIAAPQCAYCGHTKGKELHALDVVLQLLVFGSAAFLVWACTMVGASNAGLL